MLRRSALLVLIFLGIMEVAASMWVVYWWDELHTHKADLEVRTCMLVLYLGKWSQGTGVGDWKEWNKDGKNSNRRPLCWVDHHRGLLGLSTAEIFWGAMWLHLRIICLEDRRWTPQLPSPTGQGLPCGMLAFSSFQPYLFMSWWLPIIWHQKDPGADSQTHSELDQGAVKLPMHEAGCHSNRWGKRWAGGCETAARGTWYAYTCLNFPIN